MRKNLGINGRTVFFFLWVIVCGTASAERTRLAFERISLEQGFTPDSIFAICQDHRGFMWFGSEEGLVRYDGYSYQRYVLPTNDPLLQSNNLVAAICCSTTGDLWVGFEKRGLAKIEAGSDELIPFPAGADGETGLTSRKISVVMEDRSGSLWVGTSDRWLFRSDSRKKKFSRFPLGSERDEEKGDDLITAILQDRTGAIWVGAWGYGLYRISPGLDRIEHFRAVPGDRTSLSTDLVTSIAEDREGDIWVGTAGGGLNLLVRGKTGTSFLRFLKTLDDSNSLSHDEISLLWVDREGMLWIGTSGGGINILDPRTRKIFHHMTDSRDHRSLSSNMIASLYQDSSGLIWVGTWGNGLNKLNPHKIRFAFAQNDPDLPFSLSSNEVRSILEDRSGTVWIGTWGGGLNRWDRTSGKFFHYLPVPTEPPSSRNNAISAICEDGGGILWTATEAGELFRFDRSRGRFDLHQAIRRCNPGNHAHVLVEDRSGTLWVGTTECGIIRLNSAREVSGIFRHDPLDPGSLPDDSIFDIFEDSTKTLWIGTKKGLTRFDGTGGRSVPWDTGTSVPPELRHGLVYDILEDPRTGMVWIGTEAGLFGYSTRSNSFQDANRRFHLPPCHVGGIENDGAGNLWLMTNNGLIRLNPGQNRFHIFSTLDGLQANVINYRARFRCRNGEMVVGTNNGLNWFNPEDVRDSGFIPPVVLTRIKTASGALSEAAVAARAGGLTISQTHLPVTLAFSAMSFADPARNRYAFRLEKRDRDWVQLGTRHELTLDRLGTGAYTLRIKGSNADGIWNENGISLGLTIAPPWWKEWWLWTATLLLLSVFSFLLYWKFVRPRSISFQAVDEAAFQDFCARHDISNREREIVGLIIRGKSNKEIEEALFIALSTVKSHLYNVYQKAGVKSRLELLYKIQHGRKR